MCDHHKVQIKVPALWPVGQTRSVRTPRETKAYKKPSFVGPEVACVEYEVLWSECENGLAACTVGIGPLAA